MNSKMRTKSVLPLVGLFLVLGVQHVISESLLLDDHRECGFSSEEEDLCASYCHRSMKLGLAYIIELKEKIKILEENHSGSENSQLSKAVENLQSKIDQQNIQIANINEFITNSVRQKEVEEKAKSQTEIENFRRKVEQLKENLDKDKEESLAEQRKKNREIESLKENLATKKYDLDEAIKDLQSKNKKLKECQNEENNSNNKIGELNSKITSLKKTLEESETQLTDSNHLLEKQLNQTAEDLVECQRRPKTSCKGLPSGIYEIPEIDPREQILCEGDLEGGGWIVIHKRFDGNVDFDRTWTEYRNGFGNKKAEFFIALENLHRITNSQTYELYVRLGYHDGDFKFASYDNFRIGNEASKYKLESVGEFKGTAENAMKYNLNYAFSSFDQDNDPWKYGNCAQELGAWWHENCGAVALNGKYFNREVNDCLSIRWLGCNSLKSVQMLIRPK